MRLDDPVILNLIQQLEQATDGLRMAAGFPPRHPTPETTQSREPRWCPKCPGRGFQSAADLEHHIRQEHPGELKDVARVMSAAANHPHP